MKPRRMISLNREETIWKIKLLLAAVLVFAASTAHAQDKPNVLMIWGDDIGYWNISAYNHGMMGYKTPHMDQIANEGALFMGWYG